MKPKTKSKKQKINEWVGFNVTQDPFSDAAKIHRLEAELAECYETIAMQAQQLADKKAIIRKLTE